MGYRDSAREATGRSLLLLYSRLPARHKSLLRSVLPARWQLALRSLVAPGLAGPGPRPRPRPPLTVRVLANVWFAAVEARTLYERASAPTTLAPEVKKVYFFIRGAYGVGGTIRTVFNTANYLAGQGYDVEVVSLLRGREKPFLPLDPRVRLTPLFDERGRTRDIPVLPRRGPLTVPFLRPDQLRRLDGWASVLTHPGDAAYGRSSLLTDLVLVRALRRLGPGVLVLTRPVLNVAGARFASAAVRTVGQEHMNFPLYSVWTRAWMLRHYRKLDVLTVLTKGDERDYEHALRGWPTRVCRIPNGLPALPEEVSDQSAPVVIAAGRLTHQKGFELLISAFERVAPSHPEWELRIFGDGPRQDALERQIARGNARVKLMGRTSRMSSELARASIFALSSRFEGLPMVLIEALGAGLPAVSFDCPRGPGDVIEDGYNGVLVPPEDVTAMAAGLSRLMGDGELRRRMASGARQSAAHYCMDQIGETWRGLFSDLGVAPPARHEQAIPGGSRPGPGA
jgi:glycosyltransferase involved in cell wall biosynthesis